MPTRTVLDRQRASCSSHGARRPAHGSAHPAPPFAPLPPMRGLPVGSERGVDFSDAGTQKRNPTMQKRNAPSTDANELDWHGFNEEMAGLEGIAVA